MDNSTRGDFFLKQFRKYRLQLLNWYQQQHKGRLLTKTAAGLVLLGILFAILFFQLIRLGTFGPLPSLQKLKDIQNYTASEIYSEDEVLLGKYFVENRTNVSLTEISPDIINALIATEDARFFEHKGIDFRAFSRVIVKSILLQNDASGGGSTLSQQLAKNLFPRTRYRFFGTPINKFKEMIVARRLEKLYSKEELLNLYLNTVPFGRNIYGVQVASRQFFNSSTDQLKTEQAALLVGMLKGNSYYDPISHPDRALARRNTVLAQMQKYQYLTAEICDSLQQLPVEVEYKRETSSEGLATYFREHLRQELNNLLKDYPKADGSLYELQTDGLRIYTTIDSRMQTYAEEAVWESMSKLQDDFDKHWEGRNVWGNDQLIDDLVKRSKRYQWLKSKGWSEEKIGANFEKPVHMTVFSWKGDEQREMTPLDSIKYYYALLNAGFLVMDPYSGAIKAWVGGIDYQYFQYDHVKSQRQVGSTFKPIVYAQALRSGIDPCEYIDNQLVTYSEYEGWQPQNSDGHYGGVYSMEGGLSKSVNSVAVHLIMQTGVEGVRQLAQQMGVSSPIPKGPAIALGAADISLYEMVQVYGTFASRGVRPVPNYIKRIETADGRLIAEFKTNPREFPRVLTRDEADIMIKMLETVVDSGTAQRLRYTYRLPNDIAGKTGTTQSHADGWFLGFTPRLVAGAWVGGEYPSVRFRSLRLGQGANTALPIWARFMQKVNTDPAFRKMRRDTFAGPSEEIAAFLDCPPYLEERPLFVDDLLEDIEGGIENGVEKIFGLFKKKDRRVNESPDQGETRRKRYPRSSEESERIRNRNEKLKKKREKKKKRKEFFDKILNRN